MSPEAAVIPEMSPEAAVTPETRLLEAAVTIPTRAENPWRMTAAREKPAKDPAVWLLHSDQ